MTTPPPGLAPSLAPGLADDATDGIATLATKPREGAGRLGMRAFLVASVLASPSLAPPAHGQNNTAKLPPQSPPPQSPPQDPGASAATAPVADAPVQPGGDAAIRVLLEQASYWRGQSQPDKAVDALNRVLRLQPGNSDALAILAQVQAERGERGAAQGALSRLQQVSPNDPRIPRIDQALRMGPVDQNALGQARRMAQEGRTNEAINTYQRVFKGTTPPDQFSTEYYQTLAGTEGGFDQAREGMGREVIANPQDLKAQLAYAQILTYREQTRAEGIRRLQLLAANPATAEAARQSMHQALLWLPDNPSSVPELQAYLSQNPNDAEVVQKLQTARNPPQEGPVDEGGRLRVGAFDALNKSRLADAQRDFEAALRIDGNDGDALGGLGIVRLRQGKTDEAKALLQRAIDADPAKRSQWQAALNGIGAGAREWNQVQVLARRGDYAGAERQLRKLNPRGDNLGGQLLLADLQRRSGRIAEAEQTYRGILQRDPRNRAARLGLAGLASRQGRTGEADAAFGELGAPEAGVTGRQRADQLRAQANAVSDPIAKSGLFRAALAYDPSNPWIRLELARLLVQERQGAEAQQVMAPVATGARPARDEIQARVYWDLESGNAAEAQQLIARLPANARTPEMRQLAARAAFQNEIRAASFSGSRSASRSRLLALAAQPDPDGSRGAEIIRAFNRMGDRYGAREAVATALAANRGGTAEQRIAYSGALLEAGLTEDADRLAEQIDSDRLPPRQAQAANQIRAGIAVRQSDQLNQQGRTADAYDELAPELERNPANPDLNLALARLYQTDQQPGKALQIARTLLERDPNNLDVRRSAVGAAIANGNFGLAGQWVQEAMRAFPNDPRPYLMSADLAKAQGNNGRALRDLQTARELRRQQLSYRDTGRDLALGGEFAAPAIPGAQPAASMLEMPVRDADLPVPQHRGDAPAPDSVPPAPAPARPLSAPPPAMLRRAGYPADAPPGPAPTRLLPPEAPDVRPPWQRTVPSAPDTATAPPRLPAQRTQYASNGPLPAYAADADAGDAGVGDAARPAPAARSAPTAYQPLPYRRSIYRQNVMGRNSYAADPYTPTLVETAQAPASGGYVAQGYGTRGYGAGDQGGYGGSAYGGGAVAQITPGINPFRSGGAPAPDGSLPGGAYGGAAARRPLDPLTQDIDQQMVALREQVAPTAQGGFGFRARSGSAGLDQLTEFMAPLEATFTPLGVGKMKVQVTPTYITAGSIGSNPQTLSQFGTLSLYSLSPTTPNPGTVDATGVGLNLAYNWNWLSLDFGSSPLGFPITNPVGGIEVAPQIARNFRVRVTAEQRAVTDSVLSYAGTKDPSTGITSGGVVRDRAHIQLEYAPGPANFYIGGGGAVLKGQNVLSNSEYEFGAGGTYALYKTPTDELRVGLDLVYFGYDKNLRFFSLGGGGYFSPQRYFAALIPVNYTRTDGDLTWSIGGSLGYQSYRENQQSVFPGDSNLQAQLQTLASANPNLALFYPRNNQSGLIGGAHAEAEYKVSSSLRIGGRASFQHTGNWTEGQGLIYAKYTFNGPD